MSDGTSLQEQKLAKLKGLLTDAIQQIRKKLEVLQRFIEGLEDVENVSNDTKLVCTLLIEVKELLKNFPAIATDAVRPELLPDCSRFERFQHNVLGMVDDTRARLYTVEEFVHSTQSLPKAMTVAVTVRDITKHLKVVSSRGPRIVNLPGDHSRADSTASAEVSTSVVDIVQYYTNLEKDKVQLSPVVEDMPMVRKAKAAKPERRDSSGKVTDAAARPKKKKRRRRMTMEQQECMENVVNAKMSTLTKNRAELFQNMLNEKSMKKIFDEEREVKKKEAIVRYLDDSKVYRSGRLKKKYYTVRSFGKSWKTLWWILDSEHLSCFQSRSAQLPLKQYKLDSLTRCSWEGKISKDRKMTEDMLSVTLWGKNERKLMLGAETRETLMAWVLAIDSVQTYKKMDKTLLNPIEKWVWKDNFIGGAIKSSYDEEWSYSQSGVLTSTLGLPVRLAYRWDGEMLIGLNDISTNLGSGKWDGVSLVWYDNAANGMITTPSMRYDWDSVEREFSNAVEQHQVWTWTRNFLVSKFGGGEWIVEGEFPEPVIMFLQAMRTSRLSRMVEVDTEDEAYGVPGSARFAVPQEAAPPLPSDEMTESDVDGESGAVEGSGGDRRSLRESAEAEEEVKDTVEEERDGKEGKKEEEEEEEEEEEANVEEREEVKAEKAEKEVEKEDEEEKEVEKEEERDVEEPQIEVDGDDEKNTGEVVVGQRDDENSAKGAGSEGEKEESESVAKEEQEEQKEEEKEADQVVEEKGDSLNQAEAEEVEEKAKEEEPEGSIPMAEGEEAGVEANSTPRSKKRKKKKKNKKKSGRKSSKAAEDSNAVARAAALAGGEDSDVPEGKDEVVGSVEADAPQADRTSPPVGKKEREEAVGIEQEEEEADSPTVS